MADRILALDVGIKRIGVAISDPLGMFSIGLDTIKRMPDEKSIENINNICKDYNVVKLIVGLPLNLKGESGHQVKDVESYIEKLKKLIKIDIEYQDERLTSVLAKRILLEQKISPSKNKQLIDKKAAELILQQYLDFKSTQK